MTRIGIALVLSGLVAIGASASHRVWSDDEKIARDLRGYAPAGPARSCITPSASRSGSHYGNTVLTYDRNGTLYRSQFRGGCDAPDDYALIDRRFGTQLCSGDITEVRELTTGMSHGSCIYSDFYPYRRLRR